MAFIKFTKHEYDQIFFRRYPTVDCNFMYPFYLYDIYHELDEYHAYVCSYFSLFKFKVPYWFKTTPYVKIRRFRYGRSLYTHFAFVKKSRACPKLGGYFSNFFFKKIKKQNKELVSYTPTRYNKYVLPFFLDRTQTFLEVPESDENFDIYLRRARVLGRLFVYFEDQLYFSNLFGLEGFFENDLTVELLFDNFFELQTDFINHCEFFSINNELSLSIKPLKDNNVLHYCFFF